MCNEADHEHFIEAIRQLSEKTVLYGCECGLKFEDVTGDDF